MLDEGNREALAIEIGTSENPAFRQLFTSQFMPGATKEQADWFNELQRITLSGESAARIATATGDTDVSVLLSQVSVPTLVLHARDEAHVPFEAGRRMAALSSSCMKPKIGRLARVNAMYGRVRPTARFGPPLKNYTDR